MEEDVRNRWKEYIEELYCADEKPKLVDLRIEQEGAVDVRDQICWEMKLD